MHTALRKSIKFQETIKNHQNMAFNTPSIIDIFCEEQIIAPVNVRIYKPCQVIQYPKTMLS